MTDTVTSDAPVAAPFEMRNAEDCQRFLEGVLTTPGFTEAGLAMVEHDGYFFSDAMTETNLKDFVLVQQGPILEALADFTLLEWRFGITAGDQCVVKFHATASHCGAPMPTLTGDMIEPTQKRVTWTCAWIFTLRNGKVRALEKSFDRGSFHAGLGWPLIDTDPVQPTPRPGDLQ